MVDELGLNIVDVNDLDHYFSQQEYSMLVEELFDNDKSLKGKNDRIIKDQR